VLSITPAGTASHVVGQMCDSGCSSTASPYQCILDQIWCVPNVMGTVSCDPSKMSSTCLGEEPGSSRLHVVSVAGHKAVHEGPQAEVCHHATTALKQ
jgi:hypothetical protein